MSSPTCAADGRIVALRMGRRRQDGRHKRRTRLWRKYLLRRARPNPGRGLLSPVGEPTRPTPAPNLTTGDGTESFYKHDDYEPGQVKPTFGFADDGRLALGRVVSLRDRGAHTRFSYDNRAGVRRLSRRIATPGAPAAVLRDRYASHWYESRLDYDLADRLTGQTTGVDVPELLVGGHESAPSYTARGYLRQVNSSYGILLKGSRFDADGSARQLVYGDAASTMASFGFTTHNVASHSTSVARSAPAVWTTATPAYSLPGPDTETAPNPDCHVQL